MPDIEIRQATAEDASLILGFITELASYENAEHEVVATESDIQGTLFAADSRTEALICSLNRVPVGYAVYFFNYSTWLGKNGLFLEDLYVSPGSRGSGAGMALMKHLARVALSRNCGRFEWSVLDWNEPAIQFYQSIGARPQNEWVGYRLTGQALQDFASSQDKP